MAQPLPAALALPSPRAATARGLVSDGCSRPSHRSTLQLPLVTAAARHSSLVIPGPAGTWRVQGAAPPTLLASARLLLTPEAKEEAGLWGLCLKCSQFVHHGFLPSCLSVDCCIQVFFTSMGEFFGASVSFVPEASASRAPLQVPPGLVHL